ncbi:MAG: DUF2779 domain-containing protein [Myxococcales bacterium]|nr:DUF2779 domain-containing protein [Myxococcales bacterium]
MDVPGRADLLAAFQCERRAWLQHHPSESAPFPATHPRADDRDAVRDAARRRYPGGRLVSAKLPLAERLALTWTLVNDVDVGSIYDATFEASGVVVRAAILARSAGGFVVVEARSASSVGEAHELDVAAVAWVAERAGVPIVGRVLLHLDGEYVRAGALDDGALFVTVNVPARSFADAEAALARRDSPTEPSIAPGAQCSRPRECPFRAHCAPAGAGAYSVARLPRAGRLLHDLRELGVSDIRHIPPDLRMNASQRHAVWSLVHGREYIGLGLAPALANVGWPLRFLDFEACQPAVPRWEGTTPFQQIPTQWSMHVQHRDGRVEHAEFLHAEDSDSRAAFVQSLVAAAGTEGSIIVYSNYEATTLRSLRDRLPEWWGDLEGLVNRIVDLLPIVRDHYYHPDLDGSFSIKATFPAICPDLGYADLAITDGASAAQAWLRMIRPELPAEERLGIRSDLLAYCARDTFAMLRIRDALIARAGG